MRGHRRGRVILAVSAVAALAGCATPEEWATWRSNGAHFASKDHMVFSIRNSGSGRATVTRTDISMARDEAWWGAPVTVSQEEIIQR